MNIILYLQPPWSHIRIQATFGFSKNLGEFYAFSLSVKTHNNNLLLDEIFTGRHVGQVKTHYLVFKPTSLCSYSSMLHAKERSGRCQFYSLVWKGLDLTHALLLSMAAH